MVEATPTLAGRRILIVEDDYLIATYLADALTSCGADIVGMAASPAEAQAMVEAAGDRLEAAVLDVNLGGERAYSVADALMARKIPFVFATGYDKRLVPDSYADIPRCEKPIRISELTRLLTQQMKS